MRHASIPALLALVLLSATPEASAQTVPQPGSCTLGKAQADLNANDVFARVFNTGLLFYGNQSVNGDGYFVPKAARLSSVFASGIWVGGKVNGELRVASARYADENFWPGPLGDDGRPVNPANCGEYDRIYSVTRADVAAVVNGGARADVTQWPVNLGAPYYVDVNANATRDPNEPSLTRQGGDTSPLNIAAGERPDIIGDQGVFWVMNDAGGPHTVIATPVLGIEVRVLAFSFSRSDALGQTTFYKFTVINKSPNEIEETYVTIFADPDLGNAFDDFVGSDPEKGLGFVYNGAATDAQYGIPPALGYDFFQGPTVVVDGDTTTLGTSSISYFQNTASNAVGDPNTGIEVYNFMQGLWGDGTAMRALKDGYNQPGSAPITKFMFPGDPVTNQAWSEVNPGPGEPANTAADRRFAISTGPFTLERNTPQEIVFGIVFAQGSGQLSSISALRAADVLAQAAYDADFQLAPPPDSPPLCVEGDPVLFPGSGNCLEAVSQDSQVTLVWGYPRTNANFLGQFDQVDALLAQQDVPDRTYTFEGFNVYRYTNSRFDDATRELVATYDVVNGITTVRELQFDPQLGQSRLFVTARGQDSGLQYSYDIPNLTNFQDYYYGVSAYAYNEFSIPQINEQQPTLITVRPSSLTNSVTTRSTVGQTIPVTAVGTANIPNGVTVKLVDPTAVTGSTYRVEFFRATNADGTTSGLTTYRVINTTTNQVILDGQEYFNRTGRALAQGEGRGAVVEGLQFTINGNGGFRTFITTANSRGVLTAPGGGGPLPEYSAFRKYTSEELNFPFIPDSLGTLNGTPESNTVPRSVRQQASRTAFAIEQGVNRDFGYPNFLRVVTNGGENFPAINGDSYEWRFTGSSTAYRLFDDRGTLPVPFELWNIGKTIGDASDDYRLIPIFRPARDSVAVTGTVVSSGTPNQFNLGPIDFKGDAALGDPVALNDPYSDQIFWYQPKDATPGQSGYNAYLTPQVNNMGVQTSPITPSAIGPQIFAGMVLIGYNARNVPGPYQADAPEQGTIFRIVTTEQNLPGDAFTFSTVGLDLNEVTQDGREAALDRIAAVPNPYLGQSAYETGNISSIIRFTNLPSDAVTIRIFTVSGSLVTTLRKEGSSRTLDWNLQTSNNLPVASGMYLVHVDVAGVGERTLKLGIVNRRTQIRAF